MVGDELKKEDVLQILEKELFYLKEKYGVKRLALFGSFAKGHQSKISDIDLLVQHEKPFAFDFIELAYYLEGVHGRKVDLATFGCFEISKEIQDINTSLSMCKGL